MAEEGLAERWARHQAIAETLWAGLEEIGTVAHVARELRLPSLTTVRVPDGVDAAAVSRRLLAEYNIEIAGGPGRFRRARSRVGHIMVMPAATVAASGGRWGSVGET